MKQLTCDAASATGSPHCDFVATGDTEEEVMHKMRDHGGTVHADRMANATKESIEEWEKTTPTKITDTN
jgi:predicted small metal-binding protein